jgi:acetyl/propionyl-CoA carboxylase alpha subunit
VQRRHQKLVEESPSPAVSPELRGALAESARRVAGTVAFHSAATVEFLVDVEGGHYFLEMNTRLQVEHGVTELVTGLDLVAWQIRVAAGERLSEAVLAATPFGHAIEVRLYAEDPHAGFAPVSGRIGAWRMPDGPGTRVDAGVTAEMAPPVEYDPLLAKLMVHAEDRATAVARLRRALEETVVGGVQTDLSFHRWLVDEPGFLAGAYDTDLVHDIWRNGPELTGEEQSLAAEVARQARARSPVGPGSGSPVTNESAWTARARRESVGRRRPT